MKFAVIVVASRRRPPIITESLRSIPHVIHWSIDYAKPEIQESARAAVLGLPQGPGPYRCFRAHQDALALARSGPALILEDDARPSHQGLGWLRTAERALPMLDRFEVVSLHGRDQSGTKHPHFAGGLRFNCLDPISVKGHRMVWQLGALAYMVMPKVAERIVAMEWTGFPIDLVLCNDFTFCVLDRTPLRHDRQHGSLVEAA